MSYIEPEDLEPDEEPVTELAALVPEPEERFGRELHDRLDQRALGKNVAVAGAWAVVAALVQLIAAAFGVLGIQPSDDANGEDRNA